MLSMKNIPNILTVSRIAAVVIFVILATLADRPYLMDDRYIFAVRLAAYILAVLAAASEETLLRSFISCFTFFAPLSKSPVSAPMPIFILGSFAIPTSS